ncbi:GNAT family N-acetyltransferase [Ureibacillus sinduriensis]|uniref:Acetyltransferase n=1 Tax=Ureibacillus sinduriensis BLB-1 = JCM 15800 TaxID=1384057 RepID=A0A0A3I0Y3_9BACL|nr:GNAT family N-acetyltransferase [Ureibacillus sinduriensis]KGR76273.1 acetyltransferase [Ureibacillus sinduriensis BLB-1 = JCM 15800]
MIIRLADSKDIDQLIKMRWDFTLEHNERKMNYSYSEYEIEFRSFFKKAVTSGQWFVWVVEEAGKIVSHIYIELIQKVPRPGRVTHPFVYMTNVYTVPEYRNMGVGSKLLNFINNWIKENEYEFVIVWPNIEAISYYQKNGYVFSKEPMEYFPS